MTRENAEEILEPLASRSLDQEMQVRCTDRKSIRLYAEALAPLRGQILYSLLVLLQRPLPGREVGFERNVQSFSGRKWSSTSSGFYRERTAVFLGLFREEALLTLHLRGLMQVVVQV